MVIINVQVVGERDHEKCYFRVKDIMKGFELNRLDDVLIDKNKGYKENNDYKYFYCFFPLMVQKKQ